MRCTAQIAFAALLGSTLASSALAQPLDARSIRPAVMLLVDTSGSMERLPDTGSGSSDQDLPECTGNSALDSQRKNRWTSTVEALTGTIQNYTCQRVDRSTYATSEYDYGYYLPHIDFGANPEQASDGILDSFAQRVKFGLMTFDGVGTTIGGDTLVGISNWDDASFLNRANGAPGMYSYGRVGRLSFPGCPEPYGVNAGARAPGNHAGAMVRVGLSDANDDVLAINQRIQSSLLNVRPYGGTPVAAMLDDLEFYLRGGSSGDPESDLAQGADPLYQCRSRKAILITDGAPDALFRDARFQCDQPDGASQHASCAASTAPDGTVEARCSCPYDPAETVAQRLIRTGLLEKLIVVAYNVREPTALATLNGIAQAGWPTSDTKLPGEAPYPFLVVAENQNDLRQRLDELLGNASPGVTSRSVPISINTGDDALGGENNNNKRFDITAGFQVSGNADEPWSGLLYRRRAQCDGTTFRDDLPLDSSEGDLLHVNLARQGSNGRRLFTVLPSDATLATGTLRNNQYRPSVVVATDSSYDDSRLGVTYDAQNHRRPVSGLFTSADRVPSDDSVSVLQGHATENLTLDVSFDSSMNLAFFGDADNNGQPAQAADRQRVVDYVRGVTRAQNPLGDIYHSNPVGLPPVSLTSGRFDDFDSRYASWRRSLVRNDNGPHYGQDGRPGIIFVGTNDGILHAFSLDTWRELGGTEHKGGDELWGFIPPALFGKMPAMVAPTHQFMFDGTPEVKDVVLQEQANGQPIFRTVLVSSVRGAPAFVALDVTYPEQPVFLWQTTFPDVGDTIGNVGLTQVRVDWRGQPQTRAVAILPGGAGEQAASCPAAGHALDEARRAAYPTGNARNVRCWKRQGRGLYVVDVATGQLLQEFGPEHFPSPLTGSISVDGLGVANSAAAYFFDQDGVLWRLSMVHADPSQWRVEPIYDMFANPLITSVPVPRTPLQPWQAGRVPTYAPALTRDRAGNLVILAGSGDPDNALDQARHRVVSLTERRTDVGGEIGGLVELNWQIDLDENEVVTGPLTVFQEVVYFGTFTSESGTNNQCALGSSKMWGAHAFDTLDPDARPGQPLPKLVLQTPDGPVTRLSEQLEGNGSNLLLGLTITRQPLCLGSTQMNAITGQRIPTGAPGGGLYQLQGNLSGNSTGGRTPQGSEIRAINPVTLQVTHRTSVAGWAGIVE